MDIVSLSCVTGFAGDALLQVGVQKGMGGPTGWGLKEYFKQHGAIEALFIPGGMLTIFFVIYIYVLKLPLTYTNLAIYGVVLDLLFRETMLFPSLDKYYKYFNYFWSAVWGAIPMMIPLFLLKMTSPEVV
jgi:preprotein translocase subunit SecG